MNYKNYSIEISKYWMHDGVMYDFEHKDFDVFQGMDGKGKIDTRKGFARNIEQCKLLIDSQIKASKIQSENVECPRWADGTIDTTG